MITIETFENGTELKLSSAQSTFTGYGHYRIDVTLEYRGVTKEFSKTTTDMEAIDEAKEAGVESWEESTQILYNAVQYQIEDLVQEWMMDIDYEIENCENN